MTTFLSHKTFRSLQLFNLNSFSFVYIKHHSYNHINTTFLSCISQSLPKNSKNTASYERHKSFELWCLLTNVKHLITTIRELFTFYSWTVEEMLISFNSRVLCNITKPIWFSSCIQLSKIILICILWSLQSDQTSWDFTCYLFFCCFVLTICFRNPWIYNIEVIFSAHRKLGFINKEEVGKN